jgi:hypothetical protein
MTVSPTGNKLNSKTKRMRTSNFAICPLCDKLVELYNYAHAATLFHTDLQDIEYLANIGSVHRLHNRKGEVMICGISLFHCFDNRKTRLLDSHFMEELSPQPDTGI